MHGLPPRYDRVCIHSYPSGDTQQAIAQFKDEVVAALAWDTQHGGSGRVIVHEYAYWPAWGGDTAEFIREVKP